jgi:hypothetical protein
MVYQPNGYAGDTAPRTYSSKAKADTEFIKGVNPGRWLLRWRQRVKAQAIWT